MKATLQQLEQKMKQYERQYQQGKKRQWNSFEQCVVGEQRFNRIEEALARCTLENEVMIRMVYFEHRTLHPLSVKEQNRRKKEGLKQFFDCLYQ